MSTKRTLALTATLSLAGCAPRACGGADPPRDAPEVTVQAPADTRSSPPGYELTRSAVERLVQSARDAGQTALHVAVGRTSDGAVEAHAVRAARSNVAPGVPVTLEYATLRAGDAGAPHWRPVATLIEPRQVTLVPRRRGGVVLVAAAAAQEEALDREVRGVNRLRAWALDPASPSPVPGDLGIGYVRPDMMIGEGRAGRLLIVSRNWYPDIRDMVFWPATLSVRDTGEARVIAQQIDGTDRPMQTGPADSVFGGADQETHVVWGSAECLPKNCDQKSHLWHLIIDAQGRTRKRVDLGLEPPNKTLAVIFATPAAELRLLVVSATDDATQAHRVIPLEGRAEEPGATEQYFVDRDLSLHMIWFEGGQPRFAGPTGKRGP